MLITPGIFTEEGKAEAFELASFIYPIKKTFFLSFSSCNSNSHEI
jgi:hypothetical protein